ncbi:MAG: hypothetical protein K940chlam1_01076, partial [Candidatus Anoxychlamydiales bacterium]|nr:hypothetical protein [Candidatus Anoxychlamydiales bacterium]
EKDPKHVLDLLMKGTSEAEKVASTTLKQVKDVMHLY